MKRSPVSLVVLLCALLSPAWLVAAGNSTEPAIKAVHGKVVVVDVPAGFATVNLQALIAPPKGKPAPGQRAAKPEWKTVASRLTKSEAGVVRFTVPKLTPRRNLRVYGIKTETLPASLLTGITSFAPDTLTISGGAAAGNSLNAGKSSGGVLMSPAATDSVSSSAGSTAPRTVSESDIWKVDGDRLYFYNSTRGLQSFNITDPDAPSLLGTLRMPGAGEDMYLLDSSHVVLLKNDSFSWWWWADWDSRWSLGPIAQPLMAGTLSLAADAGTVSAVGNVVRFSQQYTDPHAVVVADVSGATPQPVGQIAFEGWLQESRLVGQVLYVASYVSGYGADNLWHSGLHISSFDLADPANPVLRSEVTLDGWMSAVYATDQYFFAAASDWPGSTVHVIDISDPTGVMVEKGTITTDGRVNDKFKMSQNGDVFTVVTEKYDETDWTPTSLVANYSLADATQPALLGSLEVAPGENLFATRFDGSLLYLVTAERQLVDPLAIIDLSDPANPKALGQLTIPGFSTFIQPLGDRLVTTGLNAGRPTVALYDVSDPAKPAQLSTVSLGTADGWAWSEATWDEKAFNVLPDQNLILLPVSGYDGDSGYSSGVQIVDLFHDKLAKRGVIKGGFYPRRAAVKGDRILSLSATKLVTVNAANRDNPVVTSDLDISWSVERVFLSGQYLVQLSSSDWYSGDSVPQVLVSPAGSPDSIAGSADLPQGYLVAASTHANVLYVLQSNWTDAGQKFTFSTVDLSHLPAVKVLAQITSANAFDNYTYNVKPLWVNDRTLVFSSEGFRSWYYGGPIALAARQAVSAVASSNLMISPWRWCYARSRELAAFDVTLPDQPKLASSITVGDDRAWDLGEPLAANDSVYLSYKVVPQIVPDNASPTTKQAAAADQPFQNHYLLKVIDYSDSSNPVVPAGGIELPGELRGLGRKGSILYTVGAELDLTTGALVGEGKFALQASGFDGAAAHLVDEVELSSAAQPIAIAGDNVFVLNPQPAQKWVPSPDPVTPIDPTAGGGVTNTVSFKLSPISFYPYWGGTWVDNPNKSTFVSYQLTDDGKFSQLASLTLDHELAFTQFDGLAVLRANNPVLRLLDTRDPQQLIDLGTGTIEGYGSSSLENGAADVTRGLWLPLFSYGVEFIPIATPTAN